MNYFISLINLSALVVLLRNRRLPHPFPWTASALLGYLLLVSGLVSDGGSIERAFGFVYILSAFIIASQFKAHRYMFILSIPLTLFILADAFRLIPSPDVQFSAGETFDLIRRPYLLEHPNVKAAWLLLMSLSPITLIGIIAAQSRGALLGYISGLGISIIPRRYYVLAFVALLTVMTLAASIRPGTVLWRLDAWREAVDLFIEHPLVGYGTGTYSQHAATGMSIAHNAALTIAAENGLIGLAALAAWLIPLIVLVARSKSFMKYNLLAFGIQQIVDDQWLHPVSAVLIGIVLAVCLTKRD